jgi:hypothetical protein
MTLVLATHIGDPVTIAADSRVRVVAGTTLYDGVAKKLFHRRGVGIATFGGNPESIDVPAEIEALSGPSSASEEMATILQAKFHGGRFGMGALVGRPAAMPLYRVEMQPPQRLPLVSGVGECRIWSAPSPIAEEFAQLRSDTPDEILKQFWEIFDHEARTKPGIGSPYRAIIMRGEAPPSWHTHG